MKTRRILLAVAALLAFTTAHAQYYIQCEDTCRHIHGIDMSHYQGSVWWETVGNNGRMDYVYLKASEGSSNVDQRYLENIAMARRYHLYVGSYHFYRPRQPQREQLRNFRAQCQAARPGPCAHDRRGNNRRIVFKGSVRLTASVSATR